MVALGVVGETQKSIGPSGAARANFGGAWRKPQAAAQCDGAHPQLRATNVGWDLHPDIGSPLLLDLPQRRWLQLQLVDSKFEVG